MSLAVANSSVANAAAKEETIKASELPKAVGDAVNKRFPGLEFTSITKETESDGKVVFDIELKQKGRKFETDVQADGTILEIEKEVATKDWPKALAGTVGTKYPRCKIQEVLEVNLVKDHKEIPDHLEVTLETADKKAAEVLTSLDGKSIKEEPAAAPASK
jgi:hypothetical protein